MPRLIVRAALRRVYESEADHFALLTGIELLNHQANPVDKFIFERARLKVTRVLANQTQVIPTYFVRWSNWFACLSIDFAEQKTFSFFAWSHHFDPLLLESGHRLFPVDDHKHQLHTLVPRVQQSKRHEGVRTCGAQAQASWNGKSTCFQKRLYFSICKDFTWLKFFILIKNFKSYNSILIIYQINLSEK